MKKKQITKAIGFDPGIEHTGFAAVEWVNGELKAREIGLIKTSPEDPLPIRLYKIQQKAGKVIHAFKPDLICFERPFAMIHGKTSDRNSWVNGAVIGAISIIPPNFRMNCIYEEFAVLEIKKKITGKTRITDPSLPKPKRREAMKELVGKMVCQYLKLIEVPENHVTDAGAVAILGLTKYNRGIKLVKHLPLFEDFEI